jgi:hypothetical protein
MRAVAHSDQGRPSRLYKLGGVCRDSEALKEQPAGTCYRAAKRTATGRSGLAPRACHLRQVRPSDDAALPPTRRALESQLRLPKAVSRTMSPPLSEYSRCNGRRCALGTDCSERQPAGFGSGDQGVLGTSERKVRLSHRQRLLRRCTSYSWSAIGLRNGRSSPRATVSGIANEYRPNMLMWSWISGESLATSASQTWCPSRRN